MQNYHDIHRKLLLLIPLILLLLTNITSTSSQPDGRGGMPGAPDFSQMDANKDGNVSQEEIGAFFWERFARNDQNHNGLLSEEEFQGARGMGMGRPGRQQPPRSMEPPMGLRGGPNLAKPALGNTESEKKILAVLEDMNQNQREGNMNVPEEDGRLMRLLTESIGAKNVVEIGTSNGYSGIWFCLGLLKTGGKLTTHDIDEGRAALARENFKRAGVENLVTLVMGDAHETVKNLKDPIDILFIDADKEGYLDYFEKLFPLVRPGGLILAHNMQMPSPDPAFIDAITTNPNLETQFYNMHASGIAVTLKKR